MRALIVRFRLISSSSIALRRSCTLHALRQLTLTLQYGSRYGTGLGGLGGYGSTYGGLGAGYGGLGGLGGGLGGYGSYGSYGSPYSRMGGMGGYGSYGGCALDAVRAVLIEQTAWAGCMASPVSACPAR